MNRQRREETTAEVGRLRDKRPLSAETAAKAQEIADYWMELDARNAIGGKEHPSAAADLWMDENGQVHESETQVLGAATNGGVGTRGTKLRNDGKAD